MTELLLFASAFALVFLLGLQSLNVNGGHYWAAALTSLGIGSAQIIVIRLVPGAGWSEIAATIAGGPLGIVCAMRAHRWLIARRRADLTAALDGVIARRRSHHRKTP